MYKLTDRMLQALEKDLRKFHQFHSRLLGNIALTSKNIYFK
jgi:hypothetical protein